jgi:hypothetical protein
MLQVFPLGVAKLDLDVALVAMLHRYVASLCSKYFICFRRILQVFDLGVAKVDLDVAYVAMAILQVYGPNGSSVFRRML